MSKRARSRRIKAKHQYEAKLLFQKKNGALIEWLTGEDIIAFRDGVKLGTAKGVGYSISRERRPMFTFEHEASLSYRPPTSMGGSLTGFIPATSDSDLATDRASEPFDIIAPNFRGRDIFPPYSGIIIRGAEAVSLVHDLDNEEYDITYTAYKIDQIGEILNEINIRKMPKL